MMDLQRAAAVLIMIYFIQIQAKFAISDVFDATLKIVLTKRLPLCNIKDVLQEGYEEELRLRQALECGPTTYNFIF